MNRSIILHPSPKYAERLLRPGLCGAMPPIVIRYQCFDGVHFAWGHDPPDTPCGCGPSVDELGNEMPGTNRIAFVDLLDDGTYEGQALVLAWRGQISLFGVARVDANGGWGSTRSRLKQWLGGPEFCTYIVPPSMGQTEIIDNDD